MSESKHGPHPGFADPIKLKLWEIRHQLDCNVQIIMRDHPEPAPKPMPHEIEIVTDHVYDRLNELEELVASVTANRGVSASDSPGLSPDDYLSRFPVEARPYCDRAYTDGYVDGVSSAHEADGTIIPGAETPCPDCGGKGAHASSGEDCERCMGGGTLTEETEAYRAQNERHRVGYRIAENAHANVGFYVRPDDESSFSPATVYPTATEAWAAFDEVAR